MADQESTVGDVYDQAIPKIAEARHAWDMERVTRPDLYGPPPRAVWKRLKRWSRARAVGSDQRERRS